MSRKSLVLVAFLTLMAFGSSVRADLGPRSFPAPPNDPQPASALADITAPPRADPVTSPRLVITGIFLTLAVAGIGMAVKRGLAAKKEAAGDQAKGVESEL